MTRAGPLTSFVGRDVALREVRDLLGASRLVTITGTGGIGKTRLAVEVARRARKAFGGDVTVVELAPVVNGSEVASAVAAALTVPDQSTRPIPEQVALHLEGRHCLLVLDNCEHVLDAAADLVEHLLSEVERLTVVTTSREPLDLPGEQVYALGPLGLPSAERRADRAAVDGAEAVRLLVDRARALVPGFEVTDANRSAVLQLCERLDGMPLALELAAVRLRSLSVHQVLDRLDERFTLLSRGSRAEVPRHRTLWDLVDWSHELCTPQERLLWARLSVFPAAFDLAAAEAVGTCEDLLAADVLDVLDRLVAKSIVTADATGEEVRFGMLVTMREYGLTRLAERGQEAEVRCRHRDHFLRLASDVVRDWSGPEQPAALARMRRSHADLLAALEWSTTTPGEWARAAQLGSLLRYHWIAGGFLSDGRRWLERILATSAGPSVERGAALWVAAWVCLIQGDRDAAAGHLAACREVAAALDDAVLTARADHWTALMHLFSGDTAAAITRYEAAIAVFDEVGEHAGAETALFQLAMAQTYDGSPEAALRTCERVLARCTARGEQWCRAYALWVSGVGHWHLGDLAASRRAALAALELQRAFQDGICTALTLELTSWLACGEGQVERAAELSGAARAVWRRLGTTIEAFGPGITADGDRMTALIDARLGPASAEALRAAQSGLSKADAVELALGRRAAVRGGGGGALATEQGACPLTPRELEVAQHIADGLSNRAIADRLVISVRTVDGHVERILAKLEFTSRAQVARWVAERSALAQR
ncbi:Predicted ATPase [Quadrisphaera granulorum]|uniref:Putative ATPase n=1 Tax=Quadrisphaera granulorum TaxID=317664 RepID=A0A316A886_9ACTN|nr:LuxR C-terminal-related transcriptional regulator [Quadrisphaera granulorum]PWJ54136.1 putative ATPase [Quadrisphaera granulorum]SZE96275.1 Predicted ATPase [Quadrisphaera granulorum]